MRSQRYFRTLLAGIAVLALAVTSVACGDDDDDDAGAETPSGNGAATASPSGNGSAAETTFELLMNESDGNVFVLDGESNPTLTVPAGEEITINLTNDGAVLHNMRFGGEDKEYNTDDDSVSDPDLVNPGDTAVLVFTAPSEAGTYIYQCDIHPTDMLGEVEVVG